MIQLIDCCASTFFAYNKKYITVNTRLKIVSIEWSEIWHRNNMQFNTTSTPIKKQNNYSITLLHSKLAERQLVVLSCMF